MDALKEFQLQRMQDLTQLSTTALRALKTRQFSEVASLPASAFYTAAGTLVISQFLLLVLIRRNSRRLVVDTLDTLLATVLLLVLLGVIVGLPIRKTARTQSKSILASLYQQATAAARGQASLAWQASLA